MNKHFHAEPTGNDVEIKCQILRDKENKTNNPSDENPVQWYWLKRDKAIDQIPSQLPDLTSKWWNRYLCARS